MACLLPLGVLMDKPRGSPDQRDDLDRAAHGAMIALLAELNARTDLARVVEQVCRNDLRWVVVPARALAAWEERDPAGWAKVKEWLAAKGATIVRS